MSSATLTPATLVIAPSHARTGLTTLATLVVGIVFLLTEHTWTVSLSESYSSTADEMESAAGGGNIVRRLAFPTLAALGLALLALPSANRPRRLNAASVLFAFFAGWCALSCLWSIDPGMTVRRLFVLGCWTLGAAGLARGLSGRELMRVVIAVGLAWLAVGVTAEVSLGTFRPWASDHRYAGTQHPNTTAMTLAALCFASFSLWRGAGRTGGLHRAGRIAPAMLFCLAFGFLLLTKSRTSAAGVLASLLFLWTLSTPWTVKAGVATAGVWAGALALLVVMLCGWDVADDVSNVALMGRGEQSESLTGRLPIWSELIPYALRRAPFGYGYDSFWVPDQIDRITREVQWPVREAHSAYLDLVLAVGVLAGGALVAALVVTARRCAALYRAQGRPEHGFTLALQLYCFINACTESGMVMPLFIPFVAATGAIRTALVDETVDQQTVASDFTRA